MDDDVLLGQVIVRSSAMAAERVARALAEVSRRRARGEDADLASVLLAGKLLEPAQVEHFQRLARRTSRHDDELTSTLRLAYDSADPDALYPGFAKPARLGSGVAAALPATPARRPTGRFEAPPLPPPGPVPVLPSAPSGVSTTPSGRMVGSKWGSYEILNEVARGAMGAIYRARDARRGGQEVALKVLLQGSKADPEDVERFKREARALQKLNHKAIVRFYEYGVHDGCPFVTMDFVAGTTLESIMQGGGISIDKGLVILEEVARAVDHAHSKGVVHRDLKPANVLIGNDNLARVTDFGLARILEEGGRLTRAGDLIGTPLYMSPEQIRGDLTALGPSSDVWSLGVTLYLLLTGEQPFGAKTIEEVAKKVKNDEPVPPRQRCPTANIHEDLERICLTALAKDPKLRYQSAGEFANDLRAYLHGKPILAGRVTLGMRLRRFYRSLRLKPLRVVIASVAILVAGAGIALAFGRHAPALPASDSVARVEKLRTDMKAAPGRSPEDSERELEAAARQPAPAEAESRARWRAQLAMAHRDLAATPAAGEPAARWRARHLLEGAKLAPRETTLQVSAKLLLEQALDALAESRDASLAPLARAAVANVGLENAPLAGGRALALVGDWAGVVAGLPPLVDRLARADRDAAIDLVLEAYVAREDHEAAAALAQKELGEAHDARRTELALAAAHALGAIPALDAHEKDRLALLQPIDASAAPPSLRGPIELEWASLFIDTGRPAAARVHLAHAGALDDPRRVVLEASASVLEGVAGDKAKAAALRVGTVVRAAAAPASLRIEAALVQRELSVLAGDDGVAPVPSLAAGPASARRVALADAAPTLVRAVRQLASELGEPAPVPLDATPALRALRALDATKDLEAGAWRAIALRSDWQRKRDAADALRAFVGSERETRNAMRIAHVFELVGTNGLDAFLWRDGGTSPGGVYDYYLTFDKTAAPAVERLVQVAMDSIELARARVPLDWRREGGKEPAYPANVAIEAHSAIDQASRILDVAARRDPFAASVWRARAEAVLLDFEVRFLSRHEMPAPPAVLDDAAAAVLTAAYDQASLAAMARACVAAGRFERAKKWAQRALAAKQGEPSDTDIGVVDTISSGGIESATPDPFVVSHRALLYALGGAKDDGLAKAFDEAARREPPASSAALEPREWALAALAWDGMSVDRCFHVEQVFSGEEAPDLLLALAKLASDRWSPPPPAKDVTVADQSQMPRLDARAISETEALAARLRRRRPRALAPRLYLDLVRASRGTPEDAAGAREDLETCSKLAHARGRREPALARLALAIARGRLEGGIADLSKDPDLDGFDVGPVLDRWQLHPKK